ncbi:dynamin family protein [Pyricularia oryzae 70-15]|uniref:Dynamin family protein n=3 Tax=Pyricularia oryzae TaxID=318829 RepID=G4MS10_PYRO7|nr:dynamin family protein [Pyricularia oryzae 70-15]EHA57476.1 dynamin family protein [Pyricularia oryzae 70-15]ELQ33484.1 dynamin family protein [Pyricularia oryzae Y34]
MTVTLESRDCRSLQDVVSKSRTQGISRFIDLPQILVWGDQSSGKSSVLEAISGMSFSAKGYLCIRFAAEVVLRKCNTVGTKIGIIPSSNRSDDEKKQLADFTCSTQDFDIGRAEQRRFLLQASNNYCALTRAAVNGVYGDQFFAITESDDQTPKRLRPAVLNSLPKFAEGMRLRGHSPIIREEADSDEGIDDEGNAHDPKQILRDEYLEQVKVLMQRSRGRELSGTSNPLIISELFAKQCKPWNGLIDALVKNIVDDADMTVQAAVTHVTDPPTAGALLRTVVAPEIATLGRAPSRVALKRIVVDVSVLAIESCLLSKPKGLLCPEVICDLDDDMVRHIAGESDEVTMERVRAAENLWVLETGAAELKALQRKPAISN